MRKTLLTRVEFNKLKRFEKDFSLVVKDIEFSSDFIISELSFSVKFVENVSFIQVYCLQYDKSLALSVKEFEDYNKVIEKLLSFIGQCENEKSSNELAELEPVNLDTVGSYSHYEEVHRNYILNCLLGLEQFASMSACNIAMALRTIKDRELYNLATDDNGNKFSNIYDYSKYFFDIARGSVSNYLAIANNFGVYDEIKETYVLSSDLAEYSMTQLVILKHHSKQELLERKDIFLSLSTRELKKLIADEDKTRNITKGGEKALIEKNEGYVDEDLYSDCDEVEGQIDIMNLPEEDKKPFMSLTIGNNNEGLSSSQLDLLGKWLKSNGKGRKFKLCLVLDED